MRTKQASSSRRARFSGRGRGCWLAKRSRAVLGRRVSVSGAAEEQDRDVDPRERKGPPPRSFDCLGSGALRRGSGGEGLADARQGRVSWLYPTAFCIAAEWYLYMFVYSIFARIRKRKGERERETLWEIAHEEGGTARPRHGQGTLYV